MPSIGTLPSLSNLPTHAFKHPNHPKLIQTSLSTIPKPKSPITLHRSPSMAPTKLRTLPRLISTPTTQQTPQTSDAGEGTSNFDIVVITFAAVTALVMIIILISCAVAVYRNRKRRRAAAQRDIYTTRREAYSRRRAAVPNSPAARTGDLESGPQRQSRQPQQQPPRDGERLPRYDSLFAGCEPVLEHWPLQDLRPATTRRVLTDPIPEEPAWRVGGTTPWASHGAGGERKYFT